MPNTYATFIGHKKKAGSKRMEPVVVCLVRQKVSKSRLLPERAVPATLRWRERGRGRVVKTDVVALPPSYKHESAVAGPGDALSSNQTRATVGIAINHPVHGDCVTTAGHFIEMAMLPKSVQLSVGNTEVTADVCDLKITASIDYAVLKPRTGIACDNLFDDLTRVGPVFEPTFVDIGKRVFVLDRATNTRIPTVCRGVNASVSLPEETLTNCILTDLVTHAGQSGTCLVDDQMRVWGLLRGRLSSQFSVFMPAKSVLVNGTKFL
jgi:hypothetical protein